KRGEVEGPPAKKAAAKKAPAKKKAKPEAEKAKAPEDPTPAPAPVVEDAKEEALTYKLNILFGNKDFEALEKAVDEVIAVDPESKMGKQMTSFKNTRLKQLKAQAEKK
ncbi:hypothetical protein N8526_01905, partial [Akkermansiaceae bacterium]|nr:hypothetical protein [Akkermansiaceae bacterium]